MEKESYSNSPEGNDDVTQIDSNWEPDGKKGVFLKEGRSPFPKSEIDYSVFEIDRWLINKGYRIEGKDAPSVRTGDPHMPATERAEAQINFDKEYSRLKPIDIREDREMLQEWRNAMAVALSKQMPPYGMSDNVLVSAMKYWISHGGSSRLIHPSWLLSAEVRREVGPVTEMQKRYVKIEDAIQDARIILHTDKKTKNTFTRADYLAIREKLLELNGQDATFEYNSDYGLFKLKFTRKENENGGIVNFNVEKI